MITAVYYRMIDRQIAENHYNHSRGLEDWGKNIHPSIHEERSMQVGNQRLSFKFVLHFQEISNPEDLFIFLPVEWKSTLISFALPIVIFLMLLNSHYRRLSLYP